MAASGALFGGSTGGQRSRDRCQLAGYGFRVRSSCSAFVKAIVPVRFAERERLFPGFDVLSLRTRDG